MQTYRDLTVWQKSMQLVKATYELIKHFPKEENYALSDQMRRAVISIPSNIAEGYGRSSDKDYAHFLSISRGSTFELDTQIRAAIMLDYISEEQAKESLVLCEECTKILNTLIKNRT